ncbi:MAG: DUF434 domain-containing protein [Lentimicrobiaceae bacterium]|jgi:hypothetical protein|nr:DUF434 domain-containing protein [Lentimicrobiaceae bacterium]
MNFSENFTGALHDYCFLLERKYPQKAVLKIVGDRYALSGTERTLLFRGITDKQTALNRKVKFVEITELHQNPLHIDGYNVLIIISSYLAGNLVFIGRDEVLRDTAEMHGKIYRDELIDRALQLLFTFIENEHIQCPLHFYFDQPVSFSGILSQKVNKLLASKGLEGSSQTCDSPDFVLQNIQQGIIATSDSSIIDRTLLPLTDLPRAVLFYHFRPDFFNLNKFLF